MKILIATLILSLAGIMTSCTESQASNVHPAGPAPENGAQFTEGKGVVLTEVMAKSINLQTAEVGEETLTPTISLQLQTVERGSEACGWLNEEQAASIRPGMEVELQAAQPKPATLKGKVTRVDKAGFSTTGELEVAVELPSAFDAGVAFSGTVKLPASEGHTAIAKSALLSTAEGHFVYAKNGEFYVRTPIKVGAVSGDHVEIAEGLYAGDEVVTSPVMSLWLAELQVLRGGKACTCGH